MQVSVEISFRLADADARSTSVVERLADDVELAVEGVGELVGWDLAGSSGRLLVAGDERYETRLLEIARAGILAAPGVYETRVDIVPL